MLFDIFHNIPVTYLQFSYNPIAIFSPYFSLPRPTATPPLGADQPRARHGLRGRSGSTAARGPPSAPSTTARIQRRRCSERRPPRRRDERRARTAAPGRRARATKKGLFSRTALNQRSSCNRNLNGSRNPCTDGSTPPRPWAYQPRQGTCCKPRAWRGCQPQRQ